MNSLSKFLDEQKIGLVDIGASGGLEARWRSIRGNIKAFLFEPDERSLEELKLADYVEEMFPVGLGSSELTTPLNLCRSPGASSILSPCHSFLSLFSDAKRFDVTKQVDIKLPTLDHCLMSRWQDCDFIKIDTQGTELDILRGGDALLDSPIIGLEIEVEFVRLYENQDLFGDVCSHLESKGFEFFDFVNICRWERERFTLFGQAVFGDGLFLRSPEAFAQILKALPKDVARTKARKYIAIVALYDHLDLLPVCLSVFQQYLEAGDQKAVNRLHKSLLTRRNISSFLLRVMNKLLRPLGLRTIGLQVS